MFCNEDGNINKAFPPTHWNVNFAPAEEGRVVTLEITFDAKAGLGTIVEMGFQEGFRAAQGNLDDLPAKQACFIPDGKVTALPQKWQGRYRRGPCSSYSFVTVKLCLRLIFFALPVLSKEGASCGGELSNLFFTSL